MESKRQEKVGIVTSNKMQKTVVVTVERQIMHPCTSAWCGGRRTSWRTTRRASAAWAIRCVLRKRARSAGRKRWRVVQIIAKAAQLWRRAGECLMIGMRTILQVADNSGARRLSCILPLGGDSDCRQGWATS